MKRWTKKKALWQKKKDAFDHAQQSSSTPTAVAQPAPGATAQPVPSSSAPGSRKKPVDPGEPPPQPKVRMQPTEAELFLKLAAAIKIFTSSSISEDQLVRADSLIKQYLLGFKEVGYSVRIFSIPSDVFHPSYTASPR